ncbi:MAG: hypothetical protein ACRC9M_05740 [Aeromonas sp.]
MISGLVLSVMTHYLLPTTYYLLPITYYLLPITYYPRYRIITDANPSRTDQSHTDK